MSYPTHLTKVNDIFYYRINVPTDLQQHFPCRVIKKSLKTSDIQSAKTLLIAIEYNTNKCFTLLRTGMLPDDMVRQVIENVLPTKQKAVMVKGKILSEVTRQYVMAKESGWTAKSKMEFKSIFKLLLDILGDVDIATITKPVVLELRATLQKLPANIYKKYPGKNIKQVLAETTLEPMSTKSVNKHVGKLGSLLRYCMEEGLIFRNPASGLKISENKRADEERKAYSKVDITNIIKSLPVDPSTPERYWIPLIGLYSGMRLNEISQLYHSDILQFDGLWCFSINNEKDKRLKNSASERIIPVHPTLLKLGFIEYVNNIKEKDIPRLWMNLTYCEIAGYSNIFGKWYQRYNREYVSDDPLKVFHSMRHTVTDMLKQAGVIETVIAELVGHSNGASMTMGRYGKRYQPKVLLEALEKLDYEINNYPTIR